MTRALMEGVVFSLRDSLEILRELEVPVGQVRATGGGARSALWRELQADIYGVPIRRTTADEGPAHGAALLAGVAAGLYRDVDEACSTVRLRDEVTEPTLSATGPTMSATRSTVRSTRRRGKPCTAWPTSPQARRRPRVKGITRSAGSA